MWIKALLALISASSALASYLRERRLISLADEARAADALRTLLKDIETNAKIREDVRRRNAAVPSDSSLPDDGFRRD